MKWIVGVLVLCIGMLCISPQSVEAGYHTKTITKTYGYVEPIAIGVGVNAYSVQYSVPVPILQYSVQAPIVQQYSVQVQAPVLQSYVGVPCCVEPVLLASHRVRTRHVVRVQRQPRVRVRAGILCP